MSDHAPSNGQSLYTAARNNDCLEISKQIEDGIKVDYKIVAVVSISVQKGRTPISIWTTELTPLATAVINGRLDAVKLLCQYGANANFRINGYLTLLDISCLSRYDGNDRTNLEITEVLVDHGGDVHGLLFAPALHAAVARNNPELLEWFLTKIEANVNFKAVRFGNKTPLQYASSLGREGCVRLLLAAGANILAYTSSGKSCEDLAMQYGSADLAQKLSLTGALVKACQSHHGMTKMMQDLPLDKIFVHVHIPTKQEADGKTTTTTTVTLLDYAWAYDEKEAVIALVLKGAHVSPLPNRDLVHWPLALLLSNRA